MDLIESKKTKRNKCSNGTRRFKPIGDGCYTEEEIENHKKKKTRKNKEKMEVSSDKELQERPQENPQERPQENPQENPDAEDKIDTEDKPDAVSLEDSEDYGKENDDLKEKEKKEYYANLKNPNSKINFLYPSLENPYFGKQVSLQKDFANLKFDGEIADKHDIKKVSNMICANPEFELLAHQHFVKRFMSGQTPYKSILLYHGLGSGKTCSAIGISEEMRSYTKQTGVNSRIYIIASPNVQDNFRLQLFDETKLVQTNGVWSLNTCVGTKILNEINPTNAPLQREKMVSQAKTIINRDYKFMGYLEFANYIDRKINVLSPSAEQELIKKYFSNCLIIIDEVHNCTKDSKTLSSQLKKIAKHADDLRFVLLSATPMYNSPREIIWITNLMNLNDGRSAIKYSDVFLEDGTIIEPNKNDEDKGTNLLRRKLNGYVSYVRGENPYTFPFRVYPPLANQKFIAMNSSQELDVPLQGKVYLTEVGEIQKQVYDLVIRKSLDAGDGLFEVNDVDADLENMEKYGYSKLQAPLQSLIITFWNRDFSKIIENEDERYLNLFGQKGLDNIMKHEKKDIKIGEDAKITIKHNYEYRDGVPRIFSQDELPKYSAKIAKVCDCIRASADKMVEIDGVPTTIHGGIIIVYTQYIYGGIVPMALALEEMGFTRYVGKQYVGKNKDSMSSLFQNGLVEKRIDARTMKLRDEMPMSEFKQAKYMIISGDKYFSQNNAEDIVKATSKANMYGDEVRVILISRAASEGLDFKYVRQVHVLDPWYNMNRIEQIIGRGVRNRSHCGLVFEERNVEIYMHATTNGEKETADMYVYRYAEQKAKKIGKVTRLMKEVAIDCVLNHSQTNFTDKKMEEVAENGIVNIVPSTQTELVPYKLGDKPFSEVCDYMEDCEFKCYPEDADKKIKNEMKDELYGKEQISINSKGIVAKLKNIFKQETAYHFDTIESMESFKNATKEELYYALTQLIDGPETIVDKYGRQGKLVNRANYYMFKPVEVTNPNISLYESKIPVKTMSEYVQYEIETKDENIKTPVFGSEEEKEESKVVGEQYVSLIAKMRENLETAIREEPNELKDKNEDWYFNLNSIKCKKDADTEKTFLDFKKKYKITKADSDETIRTKISPTPFEEYKRLEKNSICITQGFFSVVARLRILGVDSESLEKYVSDHIIETLSHENLLTLAKEVLNPNFVAKDNLERRILNYFQNLLLDGKKTLVLAKDNKNIYYSLADWSEISDGEKVLLVGEMQEKMEVTNYSDIIGFVGEFSSKDMGSTMVFRTKNMTQKRNNKSAFLQNDSKIAIIKQINTILKLAGSPYSFDDDSCTKCERNTDDLSKIAVACIFEMLIRKFDDEKTAGKKWLLRPEQAIFNNIKNA
jgi:hypothetical protein